MAIWKQIPFEPKYEINELGEVRNMRKGHLIKTWPLSNGYLQLKLSGKAYTIHRLVAMVFHADSKGNNNIVLHLDDDKTNNHKSNLKWGSQSENIKMAYDKGRHSKRGIRHHLAKFSYQDIEHIRSRLDMGDGVRSIAKEFNVCHQTISQIKNRKTWI